MARFLSTVEKTDSGWIRNDYYISTEKLQMKALYKDEACEIMNGNAVYYYANGFMEATGKLVNNKKQGLYLRWHPNGMMADSAVYNNDVLTGTRFAWHPNGVMADSVISINDSTVISVSWFDNGNPSHYGYYINNKKAGKWNYFHKNGQPAAVEMNENGKVNAVEYYNEDGSAFDITSKIKREAVYKDGIKAWQQYLADKIYWPNSYTLTNTDRVTVVVSFTINEDGNTENAFVSTPFHQSFDRIALDVIKKSPAWQPALEHNRKVKQYVRQPVTFMQQ